ncbi:MarR family winged helix-turn-helix transcriptional regulator [Actinocatenispora rupis]|uniref:Transcriptional regulator n=1 Tax=Actinocatenispora rupis TaxID=519421 RepID=A0A8J3JEW3_9ACTN|nr:MarR family transcriptional regulator [Actinocatenispora rupis]GID14668.1 transcriptional regulator [Actinocatenispora rupis]
MPSEMSTVHLLREVAVQFGLRSAEFAAANGMHPTDVRALICLLDAERAGEPATAGRLGARLGLNSAGTTGVVDRLVRLGYVRRERDPHDRRRVRIVVDERAVALGEAAFGPLIGRIVDLLRTFTPAERDAIHRFLLGTVAAADPD